jgi:asparagine synthase (glutamine-hydrolysing)
MKDVLPKNVMGKSKQGGFVPLGIFLEDAEVRKVIYAVIRSSKALFEIFNKKYLEEILVHYEALMGKKGYWFYYEQSLIEKIFLLLALEIWFRQYIDTKSLAQSSFDLRDYIR